jgi:hypothetical protein
MKQLKFKVLDLTKNVATALKCREEAERNLQQSVRTADLLEKEKVPIPQSFPAQSPRVVCFGAALALRLNCTFTLPPVQTHLTTSNFRQKTFFYTLFRRSMHTLFPPLQSPFISILSVGMYNPLLPEPHHHHHHH